MKPTFNKIKFRKITKKDLPILKKWRNSPQIWQFNTQFTLLNMKNQEEWFSDLKTNSSRKMYFVTIEKQPVAICGFIHIENKNADIAIIIGDKKFRGKGLGTKILDMLLKLGFDKYNLHRIGAEVLKNNIESQKFFLKMNFTYEATFRDKIWRQDKWQDIIVYSILLTEWKKNYSQSFK